MANPRNPEIVPCSIEELKNGRLARHPRGGLAPGRGLRSDGRVEPDPVPETGGRDGEEPTLLGHADVGNITEKIGFLYS